MAAPPLDWRKRNTATVEEQEEALAKRHGCLTHETAAHPEQECVDELLAL